MAAKKLQFVVESGTHVEPAGLFLTRAKYGRYIDLTRDLERAWRFDSEESAQEHGRRYFRQDDFRIMEVHQSWQLVTGS